MRAHDVLWMAADRLRFPPVPGALRAQILAMEDFSQLVPVPAAGPATYVFAEPTLPGNGDMQSILQRYFPGARLCGEMLLVTGSLQESVDRRARPRRLRVKRSGSRA